MSRYNDDNPATAPALNRLIDYRHRRLQQQIINNDCAAALLCNPINIRYATGFHYAQVSNLRSPTHYAFVPAEGPSIVFGQNLLPPEPFPGCVQFVQDIPVPSYFVVGDGYKQITEQWVRLISDHVALLGANKRLAIDTHEPELFTGLTEFGIVCVNAEPLVEQAGVIKSDDELACISKSIRIAEQGLRRVLDNVQPGVTEQALWAYLAYENARNGGEGFEYRILSSGYLTNPWGRECSNKRIESGELIGIDTGMIGPDGYCADISRTFQCGPSKPTINQKELYQAACDNLNFNMNLLYPGLSFQEFSQKSWPVPSYFWARRYNSVAHGVGMGNEWPKIPFYQDWGDCRLDGHLQENMVLAIESCICRESSGECVKLEDMVVITQDGYQQLSKFPLEDSLLT